MSNERKSALDEESDKLNAMLKATELAMCSAGYGVFGGVDLRNGCHLLWRKHRCVWGLYVARIDGMVDYTDFGEGSAAYCDVELVPLTNASRENRISASQALFGLLANLQGSEAATLRRVRTATERVSEILRQIKCERAGGSSNDE